MSPEEFVSLDKCTPVPQPVLISLIFSQPVVSRQGGYDKFHFQMAKHVIFKLLIYLFTILDLHFY